MAEHKNNDHELGKPPIAQAAYDQLAEVYAARIETKPHNAYYERPATLSLLPDVNGKRVLDAGCGPGVYAEILVDLGGEVIAMDANPSMVRLAQARLKNTAQVLLARLDRPLHFLVDESIDIVISPLVMDYIRDWRSVFVEFNRILIPGGLLVFSIEHPMMKYFDHYETSNYYAVEQVSYTWRGFGTPVDVPSYRRSISATINPLIEAGFLIEKVLEPLPTEDFKKNAPEDYENLCREPCFFFIRCSKPPSSASITGQ